MSYLAILIKQTSHRNFTNIPSTSLVLLERTEYCAALGLSDYNLIHLIPNNRQKLKLSKPLVSRAKRWTTTATQDLHPRLNCTDWDIFRDAAADLDEYKDKDLCILYKTTIKYNNDKLWFSVELQWPNRNNPRT